MAGVRALTVLGAMYVTQGLVYGFAAFILLPTLAAARVDVQTQTGLVALAGLPWVLKIAWGPVLDRFAPNVEGLRRPATFAFVAMLAIAGGLFSLSSLPFARDELGPLATTWLLLNVALSLQDVSTDAMALDVIEPRRRGVATGVMRAGHHLGYEALGGIALGAIVAAQGIRPAMTAMAITVGVLAVVPLWMPAPPQPTPRPTTPLLALLRRLRTDRTATAVALVAAGVLFADVLTSALTGEFWVGRLGWKVEEVAGQLPWVLLPANLVGFAVAAAVADRIGHRRTAAAGTVALGGIWIVFAALQPWWTSVTVVFVFVAIQTLAGSLLYVGLDAVLMDATDRRARATHFAILTALLNLPRAIAPLAAAPLLDALGWGGLFVACGVVQIAWGWALRRLPPPAPTE